MDIIETHKDIENPWLTCPRTPTSSTVFVEGNAQIEQWQGQDGQQKSALKIWQSTSSSSSS
jgi:hypothetical protein